MDSNNEETRQAVAFGHGQQGGLGIEGGCVPPSTIDYTSGNTGGSVQLLLPEQPYKELIVTLDSVRYSTKPQGYEFAAITKRLQQAGPTVCTPTEFCDHVRHGGTWVGAVYEPSDQGWGDFIGQRLIGFDFDNSYGGAPLAPGDPKFLDPLDALIRCEDLGFAPVCLYFTFSAKCPDWPRFRLVFDMGKLLDKSCASQCIRAFLNAFPEADQKCKNPNRLFFGSQGEVWRCWGAGD